MTEKVDRKDWLMKGARYMQVLVGLVIPFAWWGHFFGTGPGYVHLDVAIVLTAMASLTVILTEIGLRNGDFKAGW